VWCVEPQWLDARTLVYRALAVDGRSALFRLERGGTESDISADFVVGERYTGVEALLIGGGNDNRQIAVTAPKADGTGTGLVLLDANGEVQRELSDAFYSRPLAFTEDGSLYYLTTRCASDLIRDYELRLVSSAGNDRVLAAGRSSADIGDAVAVGPSSIAYVVYEQPLPGARGGLRVPVQGNSALWLWNTSGGRTALTDADSPLRSLR
jgi:hypothetical protein